MIRYANLKDAIYAVKLWEGEETSLDHIGDQGNSIFSFKSKTGQPQILRFTDPNFRTLNEVKAEIEFVNHLASHGASVASGIAAVDGEFAKIFSCSTGQLICSSIEFVHGIEVKEGMDHWSPKFFQEWGKNLALIHLISSSFRFQTPECDRWSWKNEILIRLAKELIPQSDHRSLDEFDEVIGLCSQLSATRENFGLIHADHAPQNFRYDFQNNKLTSFDFGNCCYHWYMADLAISLSTIRRKQNRELIRENILSGYNSIRPLDPNFPDMIDLFIRLRVLYVYLSRLHLWSDNRTAQQERDLELFRGMVHLKKGWNFC